MTKYCQNCNRPNANSAEYCIHCGETFTHEEVYSRPLEVDTGTDQVLSVPRTSGNPATIEFVLGLMGGIVGFILGSTLLLAGIFYGSVLKYLVNAHYISSSGSFSSLGTVVILLGIGELIFAIIGISGAVLSSKNPDTGGKLMIMSAIGAFICFPLVSILSFILLVIAGVITLRSRSNVQAQEPIHEPELDVQPRRHKKIRRKSRAGFFAGMIILVTLALIGISLIIIS